MANKDEIGPEIPLGKLRILGVGVIGVSLKLSMGAEMSGTISGTFSAGVSSMSDGTTRGIHNFSVTNYSVTGKAAQTFSTVSSKARKAYDRRLTYTRARSLARDETEVRALEAIYRAELKKKERRNAQKARLKMPIRAVRFVLCKLRRK